MSPYSIADASAEGFPTVVLSNRDADLHATFAPELGMVGCSLRHRGAELLGQRHGLVQYAAKGSTMGIPLLHPWANRLSGLAYEIAGRRVALDPGSALLHRDANGLPMHGLLAAYPHWQVVERASDADGAWLTARLDFAADAALLAAFPFPHLLTLAICLQDTTLTFTTTLTATGDLAVPLSFGFHPYFQLPGIARSAWQLDTPVRRRAALDAHGIPTGATEPCTIAPGPLGARTFDDLYLTLAQPARFSLTGAGRQVTLTFDDGYPCAQIYAPAGEALICFEPMTAPTNALVSGQDLRLVEPGREFTACFSIEIS